MKRLALAAALFLLSTGWTIRNLGTLPGGGPSAAFGINNSGDIVGSADHADGDSRAVYWDAAGVIQEIPTRIDKICCYASAFEINDARTVVGMMPAPGSRSYQGFLWKPGAPTVFELIAGRDTHAHSVNNFGDTTGWSYDAGWAQHALLWRGAGASVEDIDGTAPGFTEPRDIGDGPVIVGWSDRSPARRPFHRAFLWVGGRVRDLGTLGGDNSEAWGVSVGRWPDPGEATIYVVGESEVIPGVTTTRAFIWNRGTMSALASTIKACDSYEARAINKNQHVVGRCSSATGSRALLWKDGAVIDLNTLLPPGSGWILNTASDINDAGQIVGVGFFEGQTRGWVLTP